MCDIGDSGDGVVWEVGDGVICDIGDSGDGVVWEIGGSGDGVV